ncbi:hypothetical protein LZ554_009145 [Drepanopeziza brunnea f. sp. 'monogermtubi']|nr:hypothetical protein LZ554_009145 [Drepanopeziza brunnea f. sp. 'monogermtubi']
MAAANKAKRGSPEKGVHKSMSVNGKSRSDGILLTARLIAETEREGRASKASLKVKSGSAPRTVDTKRKDGNTKASPVANACSGVQGGKKRTASIPYTSMSRNSENKTQAEALKMKSRSMSTSALSTALPAKQTSLEEPASVYTVPVKPKLHKRFYEALALLSVLGRNRGEQLDEEPLDFGGEESDSSSQKLRRAFLRSLAYLCDYEKGGDRTTAVALQATPQETVFWIASNKSSSSAASDSGIDRVRLFLEDTLRNLTAIRIEFVRRVEDDVFEKAVRFSGKRISDYVKFLRQQLGPILKSMEISQDEADAGFQTWLGELETAAAQPIAICKMCYETRHSAEYRSLQYRASPGSHHAAYCARLRHAIGRLNHTMKAVKVVVSAGLQFPHWFDSFSVKRTSSSHSSASPLSGKPASLMGIVGRMTSDVREMALYREALRDMDRRFKLSDDFQNQCRSATWKPRVHAELLLVDLFWRRGFEFVDGDRYIGCSKPACYCCYHYIQNHPGRFVVPACHNNNWLNWRAPDIKERCRSDLVDARAAVLQKMVEKIRLDVFDQIRQRRGPAKWKADSLTEISTVRPGPSGLVDLDGENLLGKTISKEGSYASSELEYESSSSGDSADGDDGSENKWALDVKGGLDYPELSETGSTVASFANVEKELVDDSDDSEDEDIGGGVSLLIEYEVEN